VSGAVLQVAVGILHSAKGGEESLLLRRRATLALVEFPGMWAFPGGKVDPGESPGMALVREIREECGVEVVAFERIGALSFEPPVTRGRFELVYYDVLAFHGTPRAVEEDTHVLWASEALFTALRPKLTIGTTRLYDRSGVGRALFTSGGLPASARWTS